jgi:hypothetical protein
MTTDALSPQSLGTSAPPIGESSPARSFDKGSRPSVKSLDNPSRCHFHYPNGRRCVLPALPVKSGLCLRHYNRQVAAGLPLTSSPDDSADLSADLLPDLSRLSSVDLRQFLARLLILVTQGRISPRRAAVLSYITNQLLHSTSPAKPNRNASSCKSSLARLAQEVLEGTSP